MLIVIEVTVTQMIMDSSGAAGVGSANTDSSISYKGGGYGKLSVSNDAIAEYRLNRFSKPTTTSSFNPKQQQLQSQPQQQKMLIVPLASIDETDDDNVDVIDDDSAVLDHHSYSDNSSLNRPRIIGANGSGYYSSSSSPLFNQNHGLASPLTPESLELTTPTTATNPAVSGTHTDTEEFPDTGFFSSTSLSSSKRSSIDLDTIGLGSVGNSLIFSSSQYNSLQFSSLSSTANKISNFVLRSPPTPVIRENVNKTDDNDDEEEPNEEDELFAEIPAEHGNDNGNIHSVNETGVNEDKIEIVDGEHQRGRSMVNSISGSLEDLVNSFDERVKLCLKNYDENVAKLAPVQVRSADEVINNRPAWWTLTGNYGSILPIDWEKLSPTDENCNQESISMNVLVDGHDELNDNEINHQNQTDDDDKLNELINSCLDLDSQTPIKTADEVIKEIDEMIISSSSLNGVSGKSSFNGNNSGPSSGNFAGVPMDLMSQCSSSCSRSSSIISFDYVPIILRSTFYRFSLDKLKTFSLDQLQDLYEDLEGKTMKHSQELINRLAERDELEFEKEVKNTFLSLLVKIQKRRKEYYKKYGNMSPEMVNSRHKKRRYLTTVIPYCKDSLLNNLDALQALIKILKAMLDDSPAIPTMLTDYILKFICPTNLQCSTNDQTNDNDKSNRDSSNTNGRPKSSPNQSLRNNIGNHSFNIHSTLNQTLNNTIRVAKRTLSFRAASSSVFNSANGFLNQKGTVNNNNLLIEDLVNNNHGLDSGNCPSQNLLPTTLNVSAETNSSSTGAASNQPPAAALCPNSAPIILA